MTEELFELKPTLAEIYDRLERDLEVFTNTEAGQEKLKHILDKLWDEHKADNTISEDTIHGQDIDTLPTGSRSVSVRLA